MTKKKLLTVFAVIIITFAVCFTATACGEDKVYEAIFSLCQKQTDLSIEVKHGETVVYTYADGVGHSDCEDIDVESIQKSILSSTENAVGIKFTREDFTEDSQFNYNDKDGSFDVSGKFVNPASFFGDAITDVNIQIKGNYISGVVEKYSVNYEHNGYSVVISLV